jgi:hypothetical protein
MCPAGNKYHSSRRLRRDSTSGGKLCGVGAQHLEVLAVAPGTSARRTHS